MPRISARPRRAATAPGLRRLAMSAALALSGLAGPAVASGERLGIVERYQSAPSPTLGRPLAYNVYRPAEPPADGRRWPVLYLLEGRPSESDWLDQAEVGDLIDRGVAEGVIPPMLVVMPVAPFSWYVDNPDAGGEGLMKTALTGDLVAAVDARYPTARCREGRAVGGLSMGGYGALLFAIDRPDLFVGGMSFAGAVFPPIGRNDVMRAQRADQFFDGAFGRPLEIGRYNGWSLFSRMKPLIGASEPKPQVYLTLGDRDRGGLLLNTARLHGEFLRVGIDSTFRVGPGAHDWDTWRAALTDGLRWLGPRLDPTCGARRAETTTPPHAPEEAAAAP
jgi:enterochelin esterase family protein